MRPLLAIAITVSLLGGVYAYTRFADSVRVQAVEFDVEFAGDEYSVEIRSSFDAAPDPIFGTDSIKVMFRGETVYSRSDEVSVDEVIEIRPLPGVEVGENELFVSVNRKSSDAAIAVVQVLVKREDVVIRELLIPSEPGLPAVSGSAVFSTGSPADEDEQGH